MRHGVERTKSMRTARLPRPGRRHYLDVVPTSRDLPLNTSSVPGELSGQRTLAPSARWALATLSLSMLMSSLGTSIANVALPTFAAVFHTRFHDVQGVVVTYLVAVTVLVVFAGRLGDRIGHRRLLIGGLSLYTLASLFCGLASSLLWLLLARTLQGAGAAVMMALTMAFVAGTVPKERIGRAMGWLGTTSAVGTALGPSLGGLLIATLGWRAIFFVAVPLGVLTLGLAWRHLPADDAERHRADTPLLDLSLLRERTLAMGCVTNLLVTTVMIATLVVGPFYMSVGLGLATAGVGLAMSCGPVVSAVTGFIAGQLVDRHGAHRVGVLALVFMVIGAAILVAVPLRAGIVGYLAPLLVMTFGYATFQAANNTAVMAGVAAHGRGLVSGLLNLSRNLGLVIGASALGAVFAFGVGREDIAQAHPAAVASGMHLTYAVAAVLLSVALACAGFPRRKLR